MPTHHATALSSTVHCYKCARVKLVDGSLPTFVIPALIRAEMAGDIVTMPRPRFIRFIL